MTDTEQLCPIRQRGGETFQQDSIATVRRHDLGPDAALVPERPGVPHNADMLQVGDDELVAFTPAEVV